MNKKLVYDLPTRVFHWFFAGLFVTAFLIAKTIDDESPSFSYHMLAGVLLSFVVGLRLVWGFVGTKYAKFSSFALKPSDLVAYFKGVVSGDKKRWAGHNPASSWGTLVMMGFALGLGLTGYLMASGQKETFEDVHELLANGFLLIVLLHIAGVMMHALRHKDGIGFTMVNGLKSGFPSEVHIPNAKPGVAALFVVLVASFSMYLVSGYNPQLRSLSLFGNTLQLGEMENSKEEQEHHDEHGNESTEKKESGDEE